MNTREEHLNWCKMRARAYLDRGDAQEALASMISDISKHPETKDHAGARLAVMLMLGGHLQTVPEVRDFIEGFN